MRDRKQDGSVFLRPGRGNVWYGSFYVNGVTNGAQRRKQVVVKLGAKAQLTKGDARDKLRAIVAKRTGRLPGATDPQASLKRFIEDRWIPSREGNWREESSAPRVKCEIQKHILEPLGAYRPAELDSVMLQVHLNKLAKQYSDGIVKHVRIYLKSIFEEALDQGLIDRDPARKLALPHTRKPDKTVLTWEQLRAVLESVAGQDVLILKLCMISGLRPSELFAARVSAFHPPELRVAETVYRGQVRRYGKTHASENTVYLPPELVADLREWLAVAGRGADDLLFQDRRGRAIVYGNYLRRLNQLAESLELPKLNFQVLRRSFATLGQNEGTVKDMQRQLRHARPTTTAIEYMQVIPESSRAMVDAMYRKLTEKETVQ